MPGRRELSGAGSGAGLALSEVPNAVREPYSDEKLKAENLAANHANRHESGIGLDRSICGLLYLWIFEVYRDPSSAKASGFGSLENISGL